MTPREGGLLAVGSAAFAGALGSAAALIPAGAASLAMAAAAVASGAMSLLLLLRLRPRPAPAPARSEDEGQARLELLGALAAGLAHELGQPLSAARVGIEGVHYLRQLGREPSAEHLTRTLSRVGMSLIAMTQTIEHLRSLAHPTQAAAPLSEVELGSTIAALLAERDLWLRYADTRIEWKQPSQAVLALADGAGLRLILTNLLRNAVEAVAGQGEERRLVRISAGPGPVVSVHDSGPGIPPDLLSRIFDPFHSTKGDGRGIGLSLAKASAERMGARLQAVSTMGSGTVFSLTLLAVRRDSSGIRVRAP